MSFHFQLPPIWGNIFMIICALPLMYKSLLLICGGEFVEGIFILSISIFMLASSVRHFIHVIRERKYGYDDYAQEDSEEEDIFGERTAASYEKQRLRKLEDLYHSNFISKEEYEEKREEIISDL